MAAIVDGGGRTLDFAGQVQDDDLAVNQWIAGFRVANWELDLAQALSEAEVGDGFYTDFGGASYSNTTSPIDVTVSLRYLPPGG